MSTTLSCLVMSLIICGAIAGSGRVMKTTENLEHGQSSLPVRFLNVDSRAALLFLVRYAAEHETPLTSKRPSAQPYDICQACIVHCGGATTPAEQCMAPCSRACGLDILSASPEYGER